MSRKTHADGLGTLPSPPVDSAKRPTRCRGELHVQEKRGVGVCERVSGKQSPTWRKRAQSGSCRGSELLCKNGPGVPLANLGVSPGVSPHQGGWQRRPLRTPIRKEQVLPGPCGRNAILSRGLLPPPPPRPVGAASVAEGGTPAVRTGRCHPPRQTRPAAAPEKRAPTPELQRRRTGVPNS